MSNTITPTVFYRTLNVEGLEIFYHGAGPREPSTRSTGMMRMRLSMFSKGKLRCWFAEARFSGLVPGRYFTNRLKTFIP